MLRQLAKRMVGPGCARPAPHSPMLRQLALEPPLFSDQNAVQLYNSHRKRYHFSRCPQVFAGSGVEGRVGNILRAGFRNEGSEMIGKYNLARINPNKQNSQMQQLFFGRRILIMGLGLNGGGLLSAQFCLAQGAEVLVTDLNGEEQLADSVASLRRFAVRTLSQRGDIKAPGRLQFRLGCHERGDFRWADLVLKNPGVPVSSPYLREARSWTTDLALFLELYPQVPVLAVTGSKGKSSISYALHYILQQYSLPERAKKQTESQSAAMLGGNIGRSPLSYALESMLQAPPAQSEAQEPTDSVVHSDAPDLSGAVPLVLELSSWQLGDLREVEQRCGRALLRPRLACLSNILHDHQNRYQHFCDYVADKFYIFENMRQEPAGGELLLGSPAEHSGYTGPQFWGDFAARHFALGNDNAAARLHYFAPQGPLPKGFRGIYWRPAARSNVAGSLNSASLDCYLWAESGTERELWEERLFLSDKDFAVPGQHSFQNYCIASYLAYRFLWQEGCGERPEPHSEVAESTEFYAEFCERNRELTRRFRGVPFRMEQRGSLAWGGGSKLHFINDTTATIPDAAASGIAACLEVSESGASDEPRHRHCLLIAGGSDKELDPAALLAALYREQGRLSLFLLTGTGTEQLKRRLAAAGDYPEFSSLRDAFEAALQTARALSAAKEPCDYYLLLSPGYASFGMFDNEFDRGRQFNQLVAEQLTE